MYEVPLDLAKQGVDSCVLKLLALPERPSDLSEWKKMLSTVLHPSKGEVEIAVVGKYISLRDAYKSIYEALAHAGIANSAKVKFRSVEAEDLESGDPAEIFRGIDGILVPGGFGDRGVPGKIKAVKYARENGIPFFGICLGMQCAVIEFARDVCGMENANSTEFDRHSPYPVIDLMEAQKTITAKGGTMRLGAYPCTIRPGTKAASVYHAGEVRERHRHRYEFNTKYLEQIEEAGMVISGTSPDGRLVEMVELPDHPWFVACQFHPEFKSTPLKAHPLFFGFVKAALACRDRN